MSDVSLPVIVRFDTTANRTAFTPAPGIPEQLYIWLDSDDQPNSYYWDGAAWQAFASGSSGGGITELTGDVLAGPGSGSVAATIPNNSITDAQITDRTAVSVFGRSANSSGVGADIAAGANDRILRRVADALDFGQLTAGMVPNALITPAMLANDAKTFSIGITIDGAGSVITTGMKGFRRIPVAATIIRWSLMADLAGDVEFDIFADAPGTTYPPTTSIVAAAPPTLSGADFDDDTTLTGWTTSITAGDVIGFEVTGIPDTITRVTLQLDLRLA